MPNQASKPIPTAERDRRWAAVVDRDPSFDGVFVYSVASTGVYCRPSCPSRRAKPENVAFHASFEAAEAAGFRPCKRCRPDGPAPAAERAAAIARVCRVIERAEKPPSLDDLARRAGMSRFHFHRAFKAATGVTPKAYARAERARRAREGLADGSPSVAAVVYDAGFNSNGRFYETSNATLGMRPSAYRAGGAGERIRFAVGECSLGSVLVAASEGGVCAILLGDDPDALVRDLQDRFSRADLIGGDAGFERTVAQVVGFVERPALGLGLPLDIRGTAFQQRVWAALRDIPAGETASYLAVAEAIGAPRAVRAVAGACAANALAVAIPCHRVVRTDGGLSGYRWGVERKRDLLDRESA
jgi:AraC family transcriptional regulator of adaptative response/methylated-DNA-[protein]-cysteine methyltransferase